VHETGCETAFDGIALGIVVLAAWRSNVTAIRGNHRNLTIETSAPKNANFVRFTVRF
jgi:hypothetical protein